jgi:ankyrin repeat protein
MNIKKILMVMVIVMIGLSVASCSKIMGKESDKKLYLGIMNDNIEQVKESLDEGANINKIGGLFLSESNPISIALKENTQNIADYLLENGANANYTNKSGYTILMNSASKTNIHFCELLLEHGAEVNQLDKKGNSALEYSLKAMDMFSTEKATEILVTFLLDNGAIVRPDTLEVAMKAYNDSNSNCSYGVVQKILEGLIDSGYESGLDPLLEAAILGDSIKVDDLIRDNKMKEEYEQQILFFTAAFGNVETIKLLDEKGVEFILDDKLKNTPLTIASKFGQLEMTKYLLDKGLDIEATNNDQDTPLIVAASSNYFEVSEYLIQKGAKLSESVLYYASCNGNIELIKLIISTGYPLDYENKGYALSGSVENNQEETSKYLLSIGADINWAYNGVFNALNRACSDGNLEAVKFLAENGVDINDEGKPLDAAIENGQKEIVEYLIKKGVDVNAVEIRQDGEKAGLKSGSALSTATFFGWYDLVEILLENGAELEYQNECVDKDTVIITAAERGSKNILEYLIKSGSKINYHNEKGETALMRAVNNGYIENVELLLKYNAEIDLKNKDGDTALDIAKKRNNKAIIKVLEGSKYKKVEDEKQK